MVHCMTWYFDGTTCWRTPAASARGRSHCRSTFASFREPFAQTPNKRSLKGLHRNFSKISQFMGPITMFLYSGVQSDRNSFGRDVNLDIVNMASMGEDSILNKIFLDLYYED